MTARQKILKAVYPALMSITQLFQSKSTVLKNTEAIAPTNSLYDLTITLNNGQLFSLASLKGKKILLVNTASDCGYTAQYADLQKLYTQFNKELEIIGFPANDFKEQEKGTDAAIASFCAINFGVSFPLAVKNSVIKNAAQQPVFQWLSDKKKNGWNDMAPSWNFSKYLVNEKGILTHYFDPSISPMDEAIIKAIQP